MKHYLFRTAAVCLLAGFSRLSAQELHTGFQKDVQRIQPLEQAVWQAVTDECDPRTVQFVSAADDAFLYSGRIDMSDPAAPVLIWEGSTVRFAFTGGVLGLRFKPSGSGAAYYNVTVDGKIYLLRLSGTYETDFLLTKDLGNGGHECEVFKRNEAQADTDVFLGADIAAGAVMGPKPARKPVLIEFYGDSISAGACDETPGTDNYTDMVQHNCYTSYPAITCRALNAELSDIAVGGTGVCVSWNTVIMSKCWKNLYCSPSGPQYAFDGRTPDIVVINLGQNDFGWTQNEHKPFPADFEQTYLIMLREIRAQYPGAWIISATGGMSAVMQSRALGTGLSRAVKAMNDPKVLAMRFRAYTYDHPRVDTHVQMAEELVSFIRTNVVIPGQIQPAGTP